MLYIWMMSVIFYRYVFFHFSPGDLAPPYWINMGAKTISTLAGSLLMLNAPARARPEPGGFPCCCSSESGAPALSVFRFTTILFTGCVLPLGMYAACTWQMDRAMEFGFQSGLPRFFG